MDIGTILDWIARASVWLNVPENQAKVSKVIADVSNARDPITTLWREMGEAFGKGEAA